MPSFITDKNHISTAPLYETDYLSHGIQWGKHRYVRREGSPGNWRYIYPEDLKKAGQNLVTGAKNLANNVGKSVRNNIGFTQRDRVAEAKRSRDELTDAANSVGEFRTATSLPTSRFDQYYGTRFRDVVDRHNEVSTAFQQMIPLVGEASKDIKLTLPLKNGDKRTFEFQNKDEMVTAFNKNAAEARDMERTLRDLGRMVERSEVAYRKALKDYGKTPIGFLENILSKFK